MLGEGEHEGRVKLLDFGLAKLAAHTGRQYGAVDSITTSSTSSRTNHSASVRNSRGLVPTSRRSN